MTKRCKGDTAIEFAQANISNARFLLTVKESHDVMKEELADIQARIQVEEEELDALRLRVLRRLKETWKALDNFTEFQARTIKNQRLEIQRKGQPQAPKDPAIAALEEGVMFGWSLPRSESPRSSWSSSPLHCS